MNVEIFLGKRYENVDSIKIIINENKYLLVDYESELKIIKIDNNECLVIKPNTANSITIK